MSFSQNWRVGMKIYDGNLTGTSAAETGRAQETQNLNRAGTGRSPSRGVDGSNDSVEFSGTLSRLSRTLTTFETTQASRVQALAQQYQSGNYRPDSAATSKGLIADAMSAGLQ
jgi:anti-sigma28 factor (negative regulator of flagellin synthesis)